jgi:hypothetical protein
LHWRLLTVNFRSVCHTCPFRSHVVRYVFRASDLHKQSSFSHRRRSDRVSQTFFEKILKRLFPQVRAHCDVCHIRTVVIFGSALTCTFTIHLTRRQQRRLCNGSHVVMVSGLSPRRGARSGGTRRGAHSTTARVPSPGNRPRVFRFRAGDRGARIRSTDAPGDRATSGGTCGRHDSP